MIGHEIRLPNRALMLTGVAAALAITAGIYANAVDNDAAPSVTYAELATSSDSQLQVLADYERRLERGFDQMTLFQDMPHSAAEARDIAPSLATTLREYRRHDVTPMVVFEPQGVDLHSVDREVFDTFFETLRQNGVTEESIGLWAPFPEPNIPEWGDSTDTGNTSPELFRQNFTSAATALKEVFPDAKTVLLLNAATWQSHDTDYALSPSYDPAVLLRYAEGLPEGVADIAGLQGFPWEPADFDPEGAWLEADLAIALASEVGTTDVRLITGTFARMHDTTVTSAQRAEILQRIFDQAGRVQAAGYDVTIDLFAQDKLASPENTDWSYSDESHAEVLDDFVQRAENQGMVLTIYDER